MMTIFSIRVNKSFKNIDEGHTLRSSVREKSDFHRDECPDPDASGAGLLRCPFCRELYMVKCQWKTLICPNDNCCKDVATSRTQLEDSCEADVGIKDEEGVGPFEKDTDEVIFRPGGALPSWAAVIDCSSCEGKIMKFGGCNRLTCFCGQSVCYMCRGLLPKNSRFEHFCYHERYHSRLPCKLCKLCDLYEAHVPTGRQRQGRPYCEMELVQTRKNEEDAVAQRSAAKTRFSYTCSGLLGFE